MVKNPPAVQETWVWSLGWEEPLEEDMATHSREREKVPRELDRMNRLLKKVKNNCFTTFIQFVVSASSFNITWCSSLHVRMKKASKAIRFPPNLLAPGCLTLALKLCFPGLVNSLTLWARVEGHGTRYCFSILGTSGYLSLCLLLTAVPYYTWKQKVIQYGNLSI